MAKDINRDYYIGYSEGFPDVRDGQVLYDSYQNKLYIDIDNQRKLVNDQTWIVTTNPVVTWGDIISNPNYATDYELGMIQNLEIIYRYDDGSDYIRVVPMQLVAFDTDNRADENSSINNGKARMTWISRDCYQYNSIYQNGDSDGWGGSSMRSQLNQYEINSFPQVLQDNIVEVKKTSKVYVNKQNGGNFDTELTSDKLWVPSRNEILGDYSEFENDGVVYDFFTNEGSDSLLKKGDDYIGDEIIPWIFRSKGDTTTPYNYGIDTEGNLTTINKYVGTGIVVGFCL